MKINGKKLTDDEIEKLSKAWQQREIDKLKPKTTVPTFFMNELLDSPSNWELMSTFFKIVHEKTGYIKGDYLNLLKNLERVATDTCRGILEEINYNIDLLDENPISYGGFGITIRRVNNKLFLKAQELTCLDFYTLCNCIQLKSYARLLFDNKQYEESFYCINLASYIYGYGKRKLNDTDDFQKLLSHERKEVAKKANEARWQGHVEELRRKYLELDKQRQNKLDKNLTIKSVATWIYEHHNQDDLEYETIRDHLSKARKGIFTND